jgi:hypothetical protein
VFLGVDGNDPAALGLLLFVFVSVEFDFHLPADVAQELTEEWVDVIVFHVMCVARMSSRVSRSPAHPHPTMSSAIGEELVVVVGPPLGIDVHYFIVELVTALCDRVFVDGSRFDVGVDEPFFQIHPDSLLGSAFI